MSTTQIVKILDELGQGQGGPARRCRSRRARALVRGRSGREGRSRSRARWCRGRARPCPSGGALRPGHVAELEPQLSGGRLHRPGVESFPLSCLTTSGTPNTGHAVSTRMPGQVLRQHTAMRRQCITEVQEGRSSLRWNPTIMRVAAQIATVSQTRLVRLSLRRRSRAGVPSPSRTSTVERRVVDLDVFERPRRLGGLLDVPEGLLPPPRGPRDGRSRRTG